MTISIKKVKKILRGIRDSIYLFCFYIFRVFPVNERKIVITNFYGKGFGDNPKYIVQEILNQKLDYDIVWICSNRDEYMPSSIRVVKYQSIKSIWEMTTAKVWIDNCRKPYYVRKRKNQYYIQTWHGSIVIKKIESDIEDKLDKYYVNSAKHDSNMADLLISSSEFSTKLFKTNFWYKGKILECGSPRCDILFNKDEGVIRKVKQHFNISEEKHILIYAPTFRDDGDTEPYNVDFNNLLSTLEYKFQGQWVILVRFHPNVSPKSIKVNFNSNVVNATEYPDMYELLNASDILITDYSSTMFEFALTKQPVILYVPDIFKYTNDRNFYFDLHSLPFPMAKDNKSLCDFIKCFNRESYHKNLNYFLAGLGIYENGQASKQIVKKIEQFRRS